MTRFAVVLRTGHTRVWRYATELFMSVHYWRVCLAVRRYWAVYATMEGCTYRKSRAIARRAVTAPSCRDYSGEMHRRTVVDGGTVRAALPVAEYAPIGNHTYFFRTVQCKGALRNDRLESASAPPQR